MEGQQELSKKEKREIKRQVQESQLSIEKRKVKMGRFLKWIIAFAIIAIAIGAFFYFSSNSAPDSQDLSIAYEILERAHVPRPEAVTNYNSNPPTSGNHWSDASAPIARGAHDTEFPDEALVHNLEHGEIWISYRPGIDESVKEELKSIVEDSYKTVLTPRSKNDTDIAVAAWGRLDKFNLEGKPLDRQRIEDFIKRYRNKGPELVP